MVKTLSGEKQAGPVARISPISFGERVDPPNIDPADLGCNDLRRSLGLFSLEDTFEVVRDGQAR
jgi:hypothetical protein